MKLAGAAASARELRESQRLRELAQDGEAGEVRLDGEIVTGAARIPATCGLDQRGTHLRGFILLRLESLFARREKATGRGAYVTAQPQSLQRPDRHRVWRRGLKLRDVLTHVAADPLVIDAAGLSPGVRGTEPLLAPRLQPLGRAAQLRIRQRG